MLSDTLFDASAMIISDLFIYSPPTYTISKWQYKLIVNSVIDLTRVQVYRDVTVHLSDAALSSATHRCLWITIADTIKKHKLNTVDKLSDFKLLLQVVKKVAQRLGPLDEGFIKLNKEFFDLIDQVVGQEKC